jgi:hypothetical protein
MVYDYDGFRLILKKHSCFYVSASKSFKGGILNVFVLLKLRKYTIKTKRYNINAFSE